ncbi:hypothetical protein TPL01_01820 [Sulfuriferula plumbiphila]|uniref:Uncharacterized protein n=1 Tax=Sulfuriferula plumbiphila TaxID=171865 RepID=A0A512L3J6_9PROT|nr:hypothetical protein [Sulfuriferula plumbiphila]BBP02750.1 hypothetical protein SFPGR_01720 [Sulfuriferula plumbiphila]GEP29044.1 hypothetical protein TPL01_01820 [Sulfuriferula plumbiphila]
MFDNALNSLDFQRKPNHVSLCPSILVNTKISPAMQASRSTLQAMGRDMRSADLGGEHPVAHERDITKM